MQSKSILLYLTIGFLILGIFMDDVEARRKILRGRKTINRRYYRGTVIPAWSIVVLVGLVMLAAGGGLFVILKKYIIGDSDEGVSNSYTPAMQHDV